MRAMREHVRPPRFLRTGERGYCPQKEVLMNTAQELKSGTQEAVTFGEKVVYTEEFLQAWQDLPSQKQQIIRNKVGLLIANPRQHSHKVHRLKRADSDVWECYLIRRFPHRLLFQRQGDKILLVQMGSHRVVDRCHVTRFEGKTKTA